MQNYKLESGQRGEERQRNKQDKPRGFGGEKPRTQTPSRPQASSQKIRVFVSTLVNSFSFCITYATVTANHYLGAF